MLFPVIAHCNLTFISCLLFVVALRPSTYARISYTPHSPKLLRCLQQRWLLLRRKRPADPRATSANPLHLPLILPLVLRSFGLPRAPSFRSISMFTTLCHPAHFLIFCGHSAFLYYTPVLSSWTGNMPMVLPPRIILRSRKQASSTPRRSHFHQVELIVLLTSKVSRIYRPKK